MLPLKRDIIYNGWFICPAFILVTTTVDYTTKNTGHSFDLGHIDIHKYKKTEALLVANKEMRLKVKAENKYVFISL